MDPLEDSLELFSDSIVFIIKQSPSLKVCKIYNFISEFSSKVFTAGKPLETDASTHPPSAGNEHIKMPVSAKITKINK